MDEQRNSALRDELSALTRASVLFDEPLARHTTLRIGGPAFAYVSPETPDEVGGLIRWARQRALPVALLGGGSNVLASSRGFEGLVISLNALAFRGLEWEGETLIAGAGVALRSVIEVTLELGYTSLGFLGGIPGTLGGAVAMNAGTAARYIGPFVRRVEAVNLDTGELTLLDHDDISWGYRESSLRDAWCITRVWLGGFSRGDVESERAAMREALSKRKASQPLNLPNAGSIFKNPPESSSGALIEACGLKGFSIGGAQVSSKHANFIVNTGEATDEDVKALIAVIQDKVFQRYGIQLATELKFIP